jgi:hypothetical protein
MAAATTVNSWVRRERESNNGHAASQAQDREPLNQVVDTLATVSTATGEVPKWIEILAIEPSHEDIARRAYQLYEEGGGRPGHDQDDWFRAERELRQELRDLADRTVVGESCAVA